MTNLNTYPEAPASPPAARSPFGHPIPLGRWGATRVYAHWSIVVTLFVFADLLATSALPAAAKGYAPSAYWLVGIATSVVFLVTILAHELAHAVVARHYGMPAKRITLWLLGGTTELDGQAPSARADGLIAAAGPLMSFGIGASTLVVAGVAAGSGLLGAALSWLAGVSILLGLFNLLPAAPLDGGRVLRAILWRVWGDQARAQRGAARAGQGLGVVLVALGGLEVVTGAFVGLWLMLTGWFVLGGASVEVNVAQSSKLRGLHAPDVLQPPSFVAPDWWTVTQLLAALPPDFATTSPIVLADFNGHASNAVTVADLKRIPWPDGDDLRVRDVNRRRPAMIVSPAVDLADVAARIRQHSGVAVVVDEFNRPIGTITSGDLLGAAHRPGSRSTGSQPSPGTNVTSP